MNAADFADWWDKQRELSRAELDAFVEKNPNLFGVVVAASTNTAMDVAASTVDSLRFGVGMAENTPGGFGKDALRLIGLLGPVGKVGQSVKAFENAKLAQAIIDPGREVCAWVSATQALAHVGFKPGTGKLFVAVEDLVRLLGKVDAAPNFRELVVKLRDIGAEVAPIKNVKSFDDIAKMTPKNGGVVMFSVDGTDLKTGEIIGHALYTFRDAVGNIKIMDRGGAPGRAGEIFDSLAQLTKKYGLVGDYVPKQAAVLQNVSGKILDKGSAVLAMAAVVSLGLNSAGIDTVAQAFEVFKKAALGETSTDKGKLHTVAAGETLPGIAAKYYGDEGKWAVIYEANRAVIGKYPNSIKPNQRLVIPDLPDISAFQASEKQTAQSSTKSGSSSDQSDKPKGTPVEPTAPDQRNNKQGKKGSARTDSTASDRN
ncbi:MAG TPA: LysM peptidoglycan-binding domain-containing protein [Xanthobacteraceae bacterium]|jgi:nucleoid-associated protein YgaU|nr:LysM peptidoglycan-binding domain-containing protein [Xanthobacteraceae bacterium]